MSRKIIYKLPSLREARFLTRPNRFLLTVRLEGTGEVVLAHMADPGRLRELLVPERRLWLRVESDRRRKTAWTALLVENPNGTGLVSIDTTLPNRIVGEALKQAALDDFHGWTLVRSEVPVGRSRFDFLLAGKGDRRMALEVKSVTLVEDEVALFPDAVTARGARHLNELADLSREGSWESAVLFLLQRSDAKAIRAAEEIDPVFSGALHAARKAGVRILGRRCRVFLDRVELGDVLPVEIG